MRNLIFTTTSLALALSACGGWTVQPLPLPQYTPPVTRTPSIFTATPIILPQPITATGTIFSTHTPTGGNQPGIITLPPSFTPTAVSSNTPSPTTPPTPAFQLGILSCNTSWDITHGMAEVTNAYAEIRNSGGVELTEVCATLRGLDEDRAHPDKTKCVASLPAGYKITFKLTVDTGYKQDTPIQVEVTTKQGLTQRGGKDSCTEIGLPGIEPPHLDAIQPIP